MALYWFRAEVVQSKCTPLTFLRQSFSVWSRGLQPHPQILGFSQWYVVYEELFVDLLVRETEVRKKICHHFDDITPLFMIG